MVHDEYLVPVGTTQLPLRSGVPGQICQVALAGEALVSMVQVVSMSVVPGQISKVAPVKDGPYRVDH